MCTLTLREQFDQVYDSLVNGQRRQAVEQMEHMGLYNVPDMLEYFNSELNNPEIALDAAKSYFRINSR